MAKTNFEHLKDICVGNDEALEFIEAAENDYDTLKEESKNECDGYRDEINDLEGRIADLEKEVSYTDSIDAGIGVIEWSSGNLQLQMVMESLGEKIKSIGELKVLRLLEVRKPGLNR